jgi:hypothetical protein
MRIRKKNILVQRVKGRKGRKKRKGRKERKGRKKKRGRRTM